MNGPFIQKKKAKKRNMLFIFIFISKDCGIGWNFLETMFHNYVWTFYKKNINFLKMEN